MSGGSPNKRTEEIFEYIKQCVEHPEGHLEHWEDWLRVGRRRLLLLNIIYYLQHVRGKSRGVTKGDLEEFLTILYHVDWEVFLNIIKPWKSLEDTLEELLEQGLIVQTPEGAYLVNEGRIKTEKDLIYWESVKRVFDKVSKKMEVLRW